MSDKEISVIEFDPDKDAVLVLREDNIEFIFPYGIDEEEVDPYLYPICALAHLYGAIAQSGAIEGDEAVVIAILEGYLLKKVEESKDDEN